jgi:RNA polymerase sigma factor (sigma-70 family)
VEGRPLEDAELVARAKRGEVRAYEMLVERYQQIAFRTAYFVLGDAGDAEDAAQEAFMKAYRALDRFRDDTPLRPWLLTIVANEARNRRKANSRRAGLALRVAAVDAASGGIPAGEPGPARLAPSPEAAVLAAEQRALLVAAMAELREEERLALQCRFFLELNEAEMADVLDCPRGTVKSRLSRALAHLRERISPAEVAGG